MEHAKTLQDDFNALHTYLESNEDKHVPKYLFNILHASYASLQGKRTWVKTEGDHAKKGGSVVQKGRIKEVVAEAAVKVAAASQDDIEEISDSEGGSDSEDHTDSKDDSDSEGESEGEDNETEGVDVDHEASEETVVSSDDSSSDASDLAVPNAVDCKAPSARSHECESNTAYHLTIPIFNPYLISHFKKMSSGDILRQCTSAIRRTSAVSDKVSGGAPVTKIQKRSGGNIQVFIPNKATFEALSRNELWKFRFMVVATSTMETNGVVAHVVRNPKTVLDFKDKDTQILGLVSENTPRLTALTGPRDITNMAWLHKHRKGGPPSCLLLNFRTPVLANQVIKHGFTWTGVTHRCERFVKDTEVNPCVKCLQYGHSGGRCIAKALCGKCGGNHISSTCSSSQSTCPACCIQHGAEFKCEKRLTEMRDYRSAVRQRRPRWRESGRLSNTHMVESNNGLPRNQEAPITNTQTGNVNLRKPTITGDANPAEESASTTADEQKDSEETSRSESESEVGGSTRQDHLVARTEHTSLLDPEEPLRDGPKHNIGLEAKEIQIPAETAAVATVSESETDSSDSEDTSESGSDHEDTSERKGNPCHARTGALSSVLDKQMKMSNLEKSPRLEPEHEIRDEARKVNGPAPMNAMSMMPIEQTPFSVANPISESETVQQVRHDDPGTQATVPENIREVAPLGKGAVDVDLDPTPLPEDTEAIIRQLERLKAIVLARSKVHKEPTHQLAGEKRKASEPLSALSENSRSITPKRVKQ